MNEKEAIKYLKDANRTNDMLCILPKSAVGKCLIKALEEIQQYRAIGTVEEFKALKECFGHSETKSRGKAIYDNAIDKFMNKLCDHCMQQTNECYKLECPFCTDGCDIINIAEQMKGGGVNE